MFNGSHISHNYQQQQNTALFSTIESPKSSDIESTSPNDDDNNSSDDWISEQFETKSPHQILGSPIPYSDITIGVLKEDYLNENRVSVAPDSVKMLVDAGLNVVVESGGKYRLLFVFCVLFGCSYPLQYLTYSYTPHYI